MSNKFIQISGFKGGVSDSPYEPLERQTYQSAKNLDANSELNILTPLPVMTAITPPADGDNDFQALNCILASNGKYYFVGQLTISSANNATLYSTGTLSSSPTWTQHVAVGSGTTSSALAEYKDGIFWGRNQDLRRWQISSTSATTVSSGLTTGLTFLRVNHGLGILYFIHDSGRIIGKYDNSTVTLSALALNKDDTAVGIEPYGRFNIIGVRGAGSKRSKFLVWDGSDTAVSDIMELGIRGLQAFRVDGSTIHFITAVNSSSGQSGNYFRYYKMQVGGTPRLIKQFNLGTVTGSVTVEKEAMELVENNLMFGFNGGTYSLLDQVIWTYGSGNKNTPDMLTQWRTMVDGSTTSRSFLALRSVGDNFVAISKDGSNTKPYQIQATGVSGNPTDKGVYQSSIFALNNGLQGKIVGIYINHKAIPTSTGFTVSVKHYGHYPWGTSVPSSDSFTDLTTAQGSGSTTGKTQSTDNATFAEIRSTEFHKATHAEIKISFDETNGANAASIIMPIVIEVEPLS